MVVIICNEEEEEIDLLQALRKKKKRWQWPDIIFQTNFVLPSDNCGDVVVL